MKRFGSLDGMVERQRTDFSLYTDSQMLVYLIHGVTGTPTEMHYVARGLARHGWDVYATTLPGHCTRLKDLVKTSEEDWCEHVQKQLSFARDRYPVVVAAGLCAGALLALAAATTVNVDGVAVLSPTITYDGWNMPRINALLPFAMRAIPRPLQPLFFHRDGPPFGIKDEALQARVHAAYRPIAILRDGICDWWARRKSRATGREGYPPSAASKGYPIWPLKTLIDINRLITRVRSCLAEVTAPTLILQAREDDMTSPRNGQLVYDEIGAREKQLVLLDDCYHVITVDKQKHVVVRHLIDFFSGYVLNKTLRPLKD